MKERKYMTNFTDIIAIIISIIALGTTIFTWLRSYKQNKYEYISIQKTKSDLLRLIAALKSIARKATYSKLITNETIDISDEKQIIQGFLASDTWLIIQEVMPEEDITMFYTRIIVVLYEDTDVRNIGLTCISAMEPISNICKLHLNRIDKEKNRLSKSLYTYTCFDDITNAFYHKYNENLKSIIQDKDS